MEANPLARRGYLLEEDYFNRLQAQQLSALRDASRRQRVRRELAEELRIEDGPLLDSLIELEITPDTAAAFEALPLVEVAWADGDVDPQERRQVLALATAVGLELGRPAHAQLELWLKRRPDTELLEAWYEFAGSGLASRASASRARRILDGALEVARVAGGVLGFRPVSSSERAAIDRIRQALGGAIPAAGPN
jgi:tellurite resistance protein